MGARALYERGIAELELQDEKKSGLDEQFLLEFIKMEIKQKQISRADTLFKFSLEKLPPSQRTNIEKLNL